LDYGTSSGEYSSTLFVGRVTTATVPGLRNGVTYFFSVKAFDTYGTLSLPSNEVAFVPSDPDAALFADYRGDYWGYVFEGADGTNAMLDLTLSGRGAFTGRVRLGTFSTTFRGFLALDATASVKIDWKKDPFTINLQLDPLTAQLTATISLSSEEIEMPLLALSTASAARTSAAGRRHAMSFEPARSIADSPESRFRMSPDSRRLWSASQEGYVRSGASRTCNHSPRASRLDALSGFHIHTVSYRRAQGLLVGCVQLRTSPERDNDGSFWWWKRVHPSRRVIANGSGATLFARLLDVRWLGE
jgi:hypothetical protein